MPRGRQLLNQLFTGSFTRSPLRRQIRSPEDPNVGSLDIKVAGIPKSKPNDIRASNCGANIRNTVADEKIQQIPVRNAVLRGIGPDAAYN